MELANNWNKKLSPAVIIEALEEATLLVDNIGNIIAYNKSAQKLLDINDQARISTLDQLCEFIDCLDLCDQVTEFINLKHALSKQTKLIKSKWHEIGIASLQDFGVLISFKDVHQQNDTEDALAKSLNKYRSTYNHVPIMMHSTNADDQIILVSDYWCELLGYDRDQVIGKSLMDFMTNDSIIVWNKAMVILNQLKLLRDIELELIKKNGQKINVLLSSNIEFNEDGQVERIVSGMVDITKLKQAELEIQSSRQKLEEAQQISNMCNYEFNYQEGLFSLHGDLSKMITSEGKITYSEFLKLIDERDYSHFIQSWRRVVREGDVIFQELRLDNKAVWVAIRGKLHIEAATGAKMITGTFQDISEQKINEERIKKLSERLVLATQIGEIGVWEYDRFSDEVFWEEQMFKIFPVTSKPIKRFEELGRMFLAEDKRALFSSVEKIKNGENYIELESRINYNGRIKHLRTITRVIRDKNFKMKSLVGVVFDITSDKKLQDQLQKSLDEKNLLIREVHHRVKNNMQVISSLLALKLNELNDDSTKKVFDDINRRIKAMAVIHDKLYTFYNVSEVEMEEYLNNIKDEIQIIFNKGKSKISVYADKMILNIDKALLVGLVVSELLSNALRHGYPDGSSGEIEISLKNKARIELCIINDGTPISEEVLSTGTKIGMTLVRTFVNQLGGSIKIHPSNGFKIEF